MNTRRTNRSNSFMIDEISSSDASNSVHVDAVNATVRSIPPNKPLELLGIIPPTTRARHNTINNNNHVDGESQSDELSHFDGSSRRKREDSDPEDKSDFGQHHTKSHHGSKKGLKKAGDFLKAANRLAVPMMKALKSNKSKSHLDIDQKIKDESGGKNKNITKVKEKFKLESEDGHKASGKAYGAKFQKGPIHLSAMSSIIKLKTPKSEPASNNLNNYHVSEPDSDESDEQTGGRAKSLNMYQ